MPLVLTEADSHLGLANRLLAPARPARLPRLPDRRAATATRYLRHRPPGARRRADRPRRGARARFGIAADGRCLLVFGGSSGARSINQAAVDGVRRRGALPRAPRLPGARDYAELRRGSTRRPPATTPARVHRAVRRRRSPPPTSCVARAGGSVFEIAAARAAGDPRPLPARDRRPPDAPTRAGWREAGAAVVIADAELTPARLRARGRRAARRPGAAARRWRRPRAALARPDAAQRIADEVLGRELRRDGARDEHRRAADWERARAAALHRDRRRRDERPARRVCARGSAPTVSGSDRAETPLPGAPARARGSSRGVGHDAANVPRRGAEVVVSTAIAGRQPRAAPRRASAACAVLHRARAARRAVRAEAH